MNPLKTIAAIALIALSAPVAAVSYDISFTRSSYQVDATDNIWDLLDAHEAGNFLSSNSLNGFDGIQSTAQIGGSARNHSIMMSAEFYVAQDTHYQFQTGADWGRGGGIAIINNDTETLVSEQIVAEDTWWGNNWNNSDVINTDFDFTAGHWSVIWIGFEGCCSGSTSVQFAEKGDEFAALTSDYFEPYISDTPKVSHIPVPTAAILFGSAVGVLLLGRRRSTHIVSTNQ